MLTRLMATRGFAAWDISGPESSIELASTCMFCCSMDECHLTDILNSLATVLHGIGGPPRMPIHTHNVRHQRVSI